MKENFKEVNLKYRMIAISLVMNEIEKIMNLYDKLVTFLDCPNELELDAMYVSLTNDISIYYSQISKYEKIPMSRQLLKLIAHLSIYHNLKKNKEKYIHEMILDFYSKVKNDGLFFTERELVDIFRINKFLLLHLLEKGIINIKSIIKVFKPVDSNFQYYHTLLFFYPEIEKCNHPIISKIKEFDWALNFINSFCKDITLFNEWRLKGGYQNDFTRLIKEDNANDFTFIIETERINLQEKIKVKTIKENDIYLNSKILLPIEYAAYFGSINVFKNLYLKRNKQYDNQYDNQIFECAIHGRNYEIIHILEDAKVPINKERCLIEAIKCHQKELVDCYINDCPISDDIIRAILFSQYYYPLSIYAQNDNSSLNQENLMYFACEFGNYDIINILIKYSKKALSEYHNNKGILISCMVLYCIDLS